MTMNYERRNAVNRTREFLVEILRGGYAHHYEDLVQDARRCLKHYPGDFDMERAAEQAPEIFGDFEWYREQERRRKVLDELVAHDQELGLYEQ